LILFFTNLPDKHLGILEKIQHKSQMTKITRMSIALGAASLSLLGAFSPMNITLNSFLSFTINDEAAHADMQYVPPAGSRPQRTAGSGARGCTNSIPVSLNLLTPSDHTARTTLSHPTFLWHISHATSTPLVFTLTAPHAKQPIFQKRLQANQAGIMQLQLPADTVGLNQNQEYRWTVALVCSEKRPSQNINARAWIEMVEVSPELKRTLALSTDKTDMALAYTHSGIWYDGLALLNQERIEHPAEKQATDSFTSLLNQIGLNQISTF
jgi:hypothetical protein